LIYIEISEFIGEKIMDDVREQLNRPLWVGIISFVVGLLIGLVVLGWWLWPVQWTDAGPSDLRLDAQDTYLRMAIDSYTLNQDAAVAQQRIAEVCIVLRNGAR
jgi:hypothetical protein